MAAPRPQPHRPKTTWRAALSERATRGARAWDCNSRGATRRLLFVCRVVGVPLFSAQRA